MVHILPIPKAKEPEKAFRGEYKGMICQRVPLGA